MQGRIAKTFAQKNKKINKWHKNKDQWGSGRRVLAKKVETRGWVELAGTKELGCWPGQVGKSLDAGQDQRSGESIQLVRTGKG